MHTLFRKMLNMPQQNQVIEIDARFQTPGQILFKWAKGCSVKLLCFAFLFFIQVAAWAALHY